MSYNTRGLCLGEKLADKARRLVVDKLLEETDILRLQETFFAKDLDKLNSVNSNFQGAGESTTDLSLELVHGRIAGGVAIMWQRKYDSLTSIIGRLGVDWCIAITVAYNNNVFTHPVNFTAERMNYFKTLHLLACSMRKMNLPVFM